MARGGKREGAGRKKGSTTRPQLREYMTPQEIEDFIVDVIKRAKASDKLAVWLGNHIFGKPVQPVANEEGDTFKIQVVPIYNGKSKVDAEV